MANVNMLEAKTHLSRWVEAVETGREAEVVISRNGKPAARLVPIVPSGGGGMKRLLGSIEGQFVAPADPRAGDAEVLEMFGLPE